MTTIQLYDEPVLLTLREVAEQLCGCGAIHIRGFDGEDYGEVRLENGEELEIEVVQKIEDDPRCSGYVVRTEIIDLAKIREAFTAADYYAWAKDEDGNDCLACFGC